jgi:RNA polymerase sigma-70 factor, ECF subfamily
MLSESELIAGCKEFNESAQKTLYFQYAFKMKGVCIRYASNKEDAKDIMQEGFIKVFSNIRSYNAKGSLEGWIRRIMVNTAIDHYNKNKKYQRQSVDIDFAEEHEDSGVFFEHGNENHDPEFTEDELLNALNKLPTEFRIVFNMHYLEDYSHKDISEVLNIEENTSRTRLYRAKKLLQKQLNELRGRKTGEYEKLKDEGK